MNVLKLNTSPEFEIISRSNISGNSFVMTLKNENNQKTQSINCTTSILPNENYLLTLASFPNGKQGDKLSYSINGICNGKILIVGETENVQDYTKKNNNKFYKWN